MPTKEQEEKVFTIEEINLEMIKCPAGSFIMGSPESELGREGRSAYRGSWPGKWKDKRFGFRLALEPND